MVALKNKKSKAGVTCESTSLAYPRTKENGRRTIVAFFFFCALIILFFFHSLRSTPLTHSLTPSQQQQRIHHEPRIVRTLSPPFQTITRRQATIVARCQPTVPPSFLLGNTQRKNTCTPVVGLDLVPQGLNRILQPSESPLCLDKQHIHTRTRTPQQLT